MVVGGIFSKNKKSLAIIEKLASFSAKEKKVLLAVAHSEPVSSVTSTKFLKQTDVGATATRATITRLEDQGVLDLAEVGYTITDPIFRMFLIRQWVNVYFTCRPS